MGEDDAHIINSTWKYNDGKNTLGRVKSMISGGLSVGLRKDDKLVSWILTYVYGPLGMLYTLEECRGKGYAAFVTAKLISEHHSNGSTPVWTYIADYNKGSKRLFENRLGFRRTGDVVWHGIEP